MNWVDWLQLLKDRVVVWDWFLTCSWSVAIFAAGVFALTFVGELSALLGNDLVTAVTVLMSIAVGLLCLRSFSLVCHS